MHTMWDRSERHKHGDFTEDKRRHFRKPSGTSSNETEKFVRRKGFCYCWDSCGSVFSGLWRYFWVIQGKEQKASMLSRRDSAPKFETGETTTLVEEHTKQITAAEEQTSSVFAEEKALTEEALSEESEEIISESVPKQSEYLLPDSDHKFLTKEDLNGFDAEMCRIARNELYARHGRKFSEIELQAYFDRCSWYEGTIEGDIFQESILNEYEIANRDLIVAYEKEMGYR